MNGPASEDSQLPSQQNSTVGISDTSVAGSSIVSTSHQGSTALLDQNSAVLDVTQVPPNESAASPMGSGPEDGVVQKAEEGNSDKGGGPEPVDGLSEPLAVKEEEKVLLEAVNGQIELLEHTSEGVGAGEVGLIVEEGQDWIPDSDHELKRVKVYELIGSRWIDQGTAFCFGQFSEEANEALLIARSERNYNEIILSTAIRSNDVYQRQQDTLIVWTEPDGVDYALSFQDPEGCAEVWNFILEVQRHMNSTDDQTAISSSPHTGGESTISTASIIRSGHLPAPQLGVISEIERAIKGLARTQAVKERICEYIQQEDYIKAMIAVMHTAEDLENLENLHALCSLMQTILMLNDHSMYEHILEDDLFFGVVGMLEYDPDFPGHKANYRDFLHNTAQFHQPIPMRDIAIQRKIHHTYRLQFLKDVVLARALDDSTFNVLNSCIIFNQIDIITHLQQDQSFLRDVVRLFVDEDMLTGGGANPRRNTTQPQQVQPQPPAPTGPHQHMIISLNGNGDNIKQEPVTAAMDIDLKPTTSSPKLVNGSVLPVNGNTHVRVASKSKSGAYAFAPPDNLTEEDITLRREVIMLLQQLCIMGKNVQMPARMALFRTLVDRGILFAVQWALNLSEKEEPNRQMISAAGEVLSAMLDHDLNGVRGHVLKQVVAIEKEREASKKGADKAETILEMACRIMAQSKDLSVQSQIGDALKVWMDVPCAEPAPGGAPGSEALGPKPMVTRKDDPGTERYMEYFYKDPVRILLKPLADLPAWKDFADPFLPLTRYEANRFVYLSDLLYNFILQHHFRSHFHVMSSDILSRVATLFKAKDKHLRHSAFRIFRLLLKQNIPNSHMRLMQHDILKPILDLTIQESLRDNLLSCSCQEYFEHMRKENMKDLIKFCMTKHEPEVQKLAKSPLGGQRFDLLIRRYEMNNAPPPPDATPDRTATDRTWSGPGRALDPEEEDYFNADEEDSEVIPSISQQNWLGRSGAGSPLLMNNTGMKRQRSPAIGAATKGYRPPLKAPQLGALVDYDDDDEESSSTDHSAAATLLTSISGSKSPEPPVSPKPSSRSPSPSSSTNQLPSSGPPPKRAAKDDEDDDNLLEALARNNRARSQSPSPSQEPMRPREKRRRPEEDEELLDRLSKTSKKPDLGNQKESIASIVGRTKNGDDPPAKKIKVKFGTVGLAVASTPSSSATLSPTTSISSSEPGTKDGDTG